MEALILIHVCIILFPGIYSVIAEFRKKQGKWECGKVKC